MLIQANGHDVDMAARWLLRTILLVSRPILQAIGLFNVDIEAVGEVEISKGLFQFPLQ